MPFNQGIFPTSVYGQLSDSYGLPSYPSANNSSSYPAGSGLITGQGWLLFDFTTVNLLVAAGAIPANGAVTFQAGNGNPNTVLVAQSVTNPGTVPIFAVNDRGGAITVSGAIQWMTTRGLGTGFCAASLTASNASSGPLAASATTAGQLVQFVSGSSTFGGVWLLNNTSTAGAYPILIRG